MAEKSIISNTESSSMRYPREVYEFMKDSTKLGEFVFTIVDTGNIEISDYYKIKIPRDLYDVDIPVINNSKHSVKHINDLLKEYIAKLQCINLKEAYNRLDKIDTKYELNSIVLLILSISTIILLVMFALNVTLQDKDEKLLKLFTIFIIMISIVTSLTGFVLSIENCNIVKNIWIKDM